MSRRHGRRKKHDQLVGLKGRVQGSMSGLIRACVLGLLVIAQFFLILVVSLLLGAYTTYFYIVMELSGITAILILTNDNRSMSYKFGWLCIIVVLPVSGIIMFFMFGQVGKRNKLNRRISDQFGTIEKRLVFDKNISDEFGKKHPVSSRISRYIEAEGAPLYRGNRLKYFSLGEDVLNEIFEKIKGAKNYIFMEFFIVGEGALWDKLHGILTEKVAEGVEVRFLYDDFGAILRTKTNFAQSLRAEGIKTAVFNPIGKYVNKLYMNFRTHQKIIVIDGEYAYTGGFNIADEYANLVERYGHWKDCGLRIEGPAVDAMTIAFLEMWAVSAPRDEIDFGRYKAVPLKGEHVPENYCHVFRHGPALGPRSFIGNIYKQMIQFAGRKLYVMTPYLILEDFMIDTFVEAVARGVDVRIITPNIPDKKHVKWMTEYNYGVLLENGVRVYEYTPGFIHSKVIMNEHSAIVGTINMDYRSFYLHYENGVWIYDKEFLKKVSRDFEDTFKICHEITYEEWAGRPRRRKIAQMFLHVFDSLV